MSDNETKTATKSRVLFLLKYLQQYTDDEHELTTEKLISILAENGFKANRKTVRDDVRIDVTYWIRFWSILNNK